MSGRGGAVEAAAQACATGGRQAWRMAARMGAERYRRWRDLPGLIGLPDAWLKSVHPPVSAEIYTRLKRALRRERALKYRSPWLYSANRHLALLQALAGEISLAKELRIRAGGGRSDDP